MPLWVSLEGTFSPVRTLNISLWDLSLFGERMHQDSNVSAMKEIQDAIIDPPLPCPKLVNAIAQEIGLGATKLMSCFSKSPNTGNALCIRPAIAPAKLRQPLQHWHAAPLILVKVHLSGWHALYLCL
jgi:hypothetical protein